MVKCVFGVNGGEIESLKGNGKIMEFTHFWQQFEACVDKSDCPTILKVNYLMSVLQGEDMF